MQGRDPQLEKAIELVMKEIQEHPKKLPPRPADLPAYPAGQGRLTVMLSPFASLRVNSAKHLALLFVGGKVQGEILRCRSAALRMTARQTSPRMSGCHPEPAAFGGRVRMTPASFGTLRLHFFPQPTR